MEMVAVLDRRGSADPTLLADQQRALIAELIAVQARVDARLAALWDLETRLLARVRLGPPGLSTTVTVPPAVIAAKETAPRATSW
jgi:hypothetical protein